MNRRSRRLTPGSTYTDNTASYAEAADIADSTCTVSIASGARASLRAPQRGAQVAAFVLHGEAVLRRHVQRLARHRVEGQPLHQDGQEEEDLVARHHLADAAPLAHAEEHHLLPRQLVQLRAVGAQEAVGVEGGRFLPQLPEGRKTGSAVSQSGNTLVVQ